MGPDSKEDEKYTLFYDGSCPLCRFEVDHLARLSNANLEVVDVHECEKPGLPSRQAMLQKLHLQRQDGLFLTGVDASVMAWGQTRYGFLLAPLRWPVIRHLIDVIYDAWAARRFRRRYGESCNEPSKK